MWQNRFTLRAALNLGTGGKDSADSLDVLAPLTTDFEFPNYELRCSKNEQKKRNASLKSCERSKV